MGLVKVRDIHRDAHGSQSHRPAPGGPSQDGRQDGALADASFNSLTPGIATAKPIGRVERARRPRHRSDKRSGGGKNNLSPGSGCDSEAKKILEDSWQQVQSAMRKRSAHIMSVSALSIVLYDLCPSNACFQDMREVVCNPIDVCACPRSLMTNGQERKREI